MDLGAESEMNTNFVKSILLVGVVNGTENGL